MSIGKKTWQDCKKLLVIRLDNMGDLLMSTPAIRAVKKTFGCSVTVLTSSMGAGIVPCIDEIDDIMIADVPWVKSDSFTGPEAWNGTLENIRQKKFDGVIIFTVFSQNPMPAILMTYLAGIPRRLAYCRENPYHLLTDWVPDAEPYTLIRHQVERDLYLVAGIGAATSNHSLSLTVPNHAYSNVYLKLKAQNIEMDRQWILVHPGASERKREYPLHLFKTIVQKIIHELDVQVIITGTSGERALASKLCEYVDSERCRSMAGQFTLEEFTALVDIAPVLLSVNTGTVHIAAALNTPVVVLYACTNPQHTPWNVPNDVFLFPVLKELRSKNEVLRYVQDHVMGSCSMPEPHEVVESVKRMLQTSVPRPA